MDSEFYCVSLKKKSTLQPQVDGKFQFTASFVNHPTQVLQRVEFVKSAAIM